MIFVLKMLFTVVYDRKNENHWSLYSLFVTHYSIITHYSLITHYSEYKHPLFPLHVELATPLGLAHLM